MNEAKADRDITVRNNNIIKFSYKMNEAKADRDQTVLTILKFPFSLQNE